MTKKLLLICFPVLLLAPTTESFSAKLSSHSKEQPSAVNKDSVSGDIQEGVKGFNSLTKSEKRSKIKEMKQAIKSFKADKKAGKEVSTNTLLQIILAIFIPPLAVYLHEGETNSKFWISVLLTIIGYLLFGFAGVLFLGSLPGIIYALIVILGAA